MIYVKQSPIKCKYMDVKNMQIQKKWTNDFSDSPNWKMIIIFKTFNFFLSFFLWDLILWRMKFKFFFLFGNSNELVAGFRRKNGPFDLSLGFFVVVQSKLIQWFCNDGDININTFRETFILLITYFCSFAL